MSVTRRRFFARAAAKSWNDAGDHVGDFLDAIRSRRLATVSAPEPAHRATTIAHIGNISVRLGLPVQWDPRVEHFVGDPEAERMLSRAMRPPWAL